MARFSGETSGACATSVGGLFDSAVVCLRQCGVPLQGVTMDGLTSILPLGIIAGLLIGKPLGISLFCWLALRLKVAQLPEGTNFQQIMAVGILCGIGFTMSIFIASLAFGNVDRS